MYKKHTKEEWFQARNLFLAGVSPCQISQRLHIAKAEVFLRCQKFNRTGQFPIQRKKNVRATDDLRIGTVNDHLLKGLSLTLTALKHGVSLSTVKKWIREYQQGGYQRLLTRKPRGRPPKMKRKMEPLTKLPKTFKSKDEELEYLRAENALLKKVRALVEERIAREQGPLRLPTHKG